MKRKNFVPIKNGEELNLLSSDYFTKEIDHLTEEEALAIKAGAMAICKKGYSNTGSTVTCKCGYAD
jgi:hypothetical protein